MLRVAPRAHDQAQGPPAECRSQRQATHPLGGSAVNCRDLVACFHALLGCPTFGFHGADHARRCREQQPKWAHTRRHEQLSVPRHRRNLTRMGLSNRLRIGWLTGPGQRGGRGSGRGLRCCRRSRCGLRLQTPCGSLCPSLCRTAAHVEVPLRRQRRHVPRRRPAGASEPEEAPRRRVEGGGDGGVEDCEGAHGDQGPLPRLRQLPGEALVDGPVGEAHGRSATAAGEQRHLRELTQQRSHSLLAAALSFGSADLRQLAPALLAVGGRRLAEQPEQAPEQRHVA
mmetsp:Transcript_41549/g.134172  ORF Transcript_41549/g.134172 Transcript_41549/m.134172 type:complete len:284 (-) Transcript_41549:851-1702(-)